MPQTDGQLFIILALAAAAIAAAAYFIARWLKGSITITLPRSGYAYGGTVRGSFRLEARKEISGNSLTAALVATEHWDERDHKGHSRSRSREIYRSGVTLEHAKSYPAGFAQDYAFELAVPGGRPGRLDIGGDSALGQALEAGLNLLGGKRVSWKVDVRLDADGVDLAASENISIG